MTIWQNATVAIWNALTFWQNHPVRCLNCSTAFDLTEALLALHSLPASPDADISGTFAASDINHLPLGYNRVCPTCKWPMTYAQATGQLPLLPIAIVGGPHVSKSHYFPVLIDQLKRRLSVTIPGLDIRAQETREPGAAYSIDSYDLLATRYGRLFSNDIEGTVIAKTDRSSSVPIARTPMIYRFSFPSWHESMSGQRDAVEFAFRDCAGEEFIETGALHEFHRYIPHSAGILLLVDPATIPCLREKFRLPKPEEERLHDFAKVISNLINYFERSDRICVGQRISTPLAIVLTKCDLLRDQNVPEASIFREHEHFHNGGLNLRAVERQHNQLANLLDGCGQSAVLNSVYANFENVMLFGASALGHAPTRESAESAELRIGRIQPWGVMNPFLWLLYELGYVDAC